jgi:hypothetical protein
VIRPLIPPYPFRVATLDELWLWLAEVGEVAAFVFEELRIGKVATGGPLLEPPKLLGLIEVEEAVVVIADGALIEVEETVVITAGGGLG